MPIASVHKDRGSVAGKNDIRTARQFADVKAEPEPMTMQVTTNDHLGLGVTPPVRRHHPRPDFRGNDIGDTISP